MIVIVEKGREYFDRGDVCGTLPTELFDRFSCDLLLAKLNTFKFFKQTKNLKVNLTHFSPVSHFYTP